MALELGILGITHAGKPARTEDGVVVNVCGLEEVNRESQQILRNQVEQGVLAEELGYDYYFLTEHHFEPEGPEFGGNPILTQVAIAARTEKIRLGQAANILSWWHPLRLAEQAAMLDVLSNGRLEFGVGRGFQPRETEVLGRNYGTTTQDQERNRAYFEEAYNIIIKAWTEPSFSYHGEFFSLPPSYTRWHHPATNAYFAQDVVERDLDQVVQLVPNPKIPETGDQVTTVGSILKELQLLPRPVQTPYPQIWQPVSSPRSVEWAAVRGVNGVCNVEPNGRLAKMVESYTAASEAAGWPDRLDRGRPKYGWDADLHRGIITTRWVFVTDGPRAKALDRVRLGLEQVLNWFLPFGFAASLADVGESSAPTQVTADFLMDREIAIVGSAEEVAEKILKVKEAVGYEDFMLNSVFELGGLSHEEVCDQMTVFAQDVAPILAKECE